MWLTRHDTRADALGLTGLDITTRVSGNMALTAIDEALSKVSMFRAITGAQQNRLEFKYTNNGVAHENLSASESRIRDADIAKEMTALTRANIIKQAATAMLAQANTLPQAVLQLVG